MKTSSSLAYVQGDATMPVGAGFKVIAHICNDEGKWGKGFVLALSKRWNEPERQYGIRSAKTPTLKLGEVQFVTVESDVAVANMIAQHGVGRASSGTAPIRYDAVEQGLKKMADLPSITGRPCTCHELGAAWLEVSGRKLSPSLQERLSTAAWT